MYEVTAICGDGKGLMIDRASIMMENGAALAIERLADNNFSMSKSHYHTYFELYYLESGTRSHMLGDDVYETEPGDFMLFSPYTPHHSYSDNHSPFQRIVLYFLASSVLSQDMLAKLNAASGMYHPVATDSGVVHSLLQMILKEQNSDAPYSTESMIATLNTLLIRILRNTTAEPKRESRGRMNDIIEYIDLHSGEDIKLSDLAAKFYISEYYLCHEFKKYTNRTVVEYINMNRLLRAQRLLAETDDSISSIAEICGFNSLTNFNRTFKGNVGMPPSAFRKQAKAEQNK